MLQRILTGRGVEHEQHAVWCGGVVLPHHTDDLLQLGHEVRLIVQPARGVDDHDVGGLSRFERVEGDAGGIGSGFFGHDRNTHPLAPDFQLLDRRRPEGVARA